MTHALSDVTPLHALPTLGCVDHSWSNPKTRIRTPVVGRGGRETCGVLLPQRVQFFILVGARGGPGQNENFESCASWNNYIRRFCQAV